MEPEIRYCTTADGVRIAYAVAGSGPPILWCIDSIVSHVQLEWAQPSHGRINLAVVPTNTLIRMDFRGSGLSDRVMPGSLDEMVLDIEAVAARVGHERFSLIGNMTSSQAVIRYAARHSEALAKLVLVDGFARSSELLETQQVQAIMAAAKVDWTLATEAIGYVAFGVGSEANRDHGEFIRACIGPEYFGEEFQSMASTWDVSSDAASITAPTLVIKHEGLQAVTMDMTRDLAARIPNATLAVVDGLWLDSNSELIQRVLSFVNGEAPTVPRVPELPSGTAVILFADIVDSTRLTETMGDAAFRDKARQLDEAMRFAINENGGTAIEGKLLGDGVLAVFTAARDAITAALRCRDASRDAGLELHLGLHAGDVIREANNVFGGAVNIASRISSLSAPGELLVSQTVRDLARTSAGVSFDDHGEHTLKGIEEPVRVYRVTAREA